MTHLKFQLFAFSLCRLANIDELVKSFLLFVFIKPPSRQTVMYNWHSKGLIDQKLSFVKILCIEVLKLFCGYMSNYFKILFFM